RVRMDYRSPLTWLRIANAAVWLTFGLVFKALNRVPRHREIAARVLGEAAAGAATLLIGLGECLLGVWILSGFALRGCAVVQTVLIVAMNALEIRYARDLLLSPTGMVVANVGLLGIAWWVALMGMPL